MPSTGSLIYSGVIPLVKMYLTIFFGYLFARKDVFPQAAAKGASLIVINLALPALVFSSIVPAFTAANVAAIGSLALLAVVYILIGLLFGLIIREVCYVPRNFWQGIVVASGLSNWSSMPAAVVMSVTQSSPFDPAMDTDLGISFAAVFILVYHVFFWVFGLAHSISWDYTQGVPQGEAANVRVPWREKPIGRFIWRHILKIRHGVNGGRIPGVRGSQSHLRVQIELGVILSPRAQEKEEAPIEATRRISHCSMHSPNGFPDQSNHDHGSQATLPTPVPAQPEVPSRLRRALGVVAVVVTPISAIVVISLSIALVEPLKVLFVGVEGGPSWKGPDGKPPLAFVIDTAKLIGGMSVPLTLFLLGVSFARMDVKLSPGSGLPIFALLSVCAAKMILLPIVGVLITRAMITGGLINPGSKVQIFVAIFVSGTPSALNQLMVASTIAPGGRQDVLSALLLMQYIFTPLSSSVLSTVALLMI